MSVLKQFRNFCCQAAALLADDNEIVEVSVLVMSVLAIWISLTGRFSLVQFQLLPVLQFQTKMLTFRLAVMSTDTMPFRFPDVHSCQLGSHTFHVSLSIGLEKDSFLK